MDGFALLADPTRRRILDLLRAADEGSDEAADEGDDDAAVEGVDVSGLVEALDLPQPLVSKHLRALRESGVVSASVDGRRRVYRLAADPLRDVLAWVEPYRR
ncbi:metalloregulator ArsR/SmtB family transcription factor [Phycicoccus sp. SLBN-51]|uniref:ArsR/SmtB family transcription factor n=1 Tax=Phycicoccus sp. SLBN-51 TaxID=2768447 RepID=UPI0011537D2C|nr:metalloregulator ArsR/SmtB family transcription factor [Phycicoccus sp. SLBN-51]TQJ49146.1 helix-turn-helix protein [Phycicoccus sp. SLBN-51]